MIQKNRNKVFFIAVSFLILLITIAKHPDIQARYNSWYRQKLFITFQNNLKMNGFNPETYWYFRERFSPGNFIRNEKTTDFFGTFKITQLEENATALLFYQSKNLNSIDGLLEGNPSEKLNELKSTRNGTILVESDSYLLIQESESKYLFVFIRPTEEMRAANGMFDYKSEEQKLLENQWWFNITDLTL